MTGQLANFENTTCTYAKLKGCNINWNMQVQGRGGINEPQINCVIKQRDPIKSKVLFKKNDTSKHKRLSIGKDMVQCILYTNVVFI